jgi:ribonuclease T2
LPVHPSVRLAGFFASFLLAVSPAILVAAPAWAGGVPGDFDFYVLSLSWSPTYCATDDRPDPAQCGTPRGFIVHGLWPQYETGYPSDCASNMPRRVRQDIVDGLAEIMPGAWLVNHEWQKHGLCSGLNQADYFATLRRASEAVTLPNGLAGRKLAPRQIEQAFIAANQRLIETGIAVQCNRGLLDEVRICLTRDLAFRRCLEVDRRGCRAPEITVPAAR